MEFADWETVKPDAPWMRLPKAEPSSFLQVVAEPRQVGKTTLVQSVVTTSGQPSCFASADEPSLRSETWIAQQWEAARLLTSLNPARLKAV